MNLYKSILLLLFVFLMFSCDDESIKNEYPYIETISDSSIFRNEVLTVYGENFTLFSDMYLSLMNINDTILIKPSDCLQWESGIIKFSSDSIIGTYEIGIKYLDTLSNLVNCRFISHKPIETVEIPAGVFTMGIENGMADEIHTREVTISKPFLISIYEIQQDLYELINNDNPSIIKSEHYPVSGITWLDAVNFCNSLSEVDSLISVYVITDSTVIMIDSADGWRLPTEAEWEYVAISNNQTYVLSDIAWFNQNSGYKVHPSGLKLENYYGVYDIIGNLWEWCFDFYDSKYYQKEENIDPSGPLNGEYHVFRGGAYNNGNYYCRPSYRNYLEKNTIEMSSIGFRVVRNL